MLPDSQAGSDAGVGETIIVEDTGRGAFQVQVTTGSSTFLADEPLAKGGLGSGPNPYDLLSAALGSCAVMTMRLYAAKKQWPLQSARVKVTHYRKDAQSRDRFVKEVLLLGPLDESQRARLLEISTRCPVHLTMQRGADVETALLSGETNSHQAITRCEHARDVIDTCQ